MILKSRRLPFYVGITSLVVMIVVIMAILFLGIGHRESRIVAQQVADHLFSEINEKTVQRYENELRSVAELTGIMAHMSGISQRLQGTGLDFVGLHLLLDALVEHESLYSLYVGYEDGSFLQIIAMRNDGSLRNKFKAPDHTAFILRVISFDEQKVRRQYWHFLDSHGAVIGHGPSLDPDYDPRMRPWYRAALQQHEAFFTEPYIFSALKIPGVTCAERLTNGKGVFGADITLQRFAMSLAEQKISSHGTLFLFDHGGHIVAHPNERTVVKNAQGQLALLQGENAADVRVRAIVSYFRSASQGMHNRTLELRIDGLPYLVRSMDLKSALDVDQILASAAPLSDFTGYIDRMQKRVFAFSALVVFIMLPLALIISRRISSSLTKLEKESERICLHDFSKSAPFDSSIKEIHSLIQAFVLMKQTIQDYTGRLIKAKKEIEELFTAVIELLAGAIDAKSPYTGGHCKRVPELARMIAEAADAKREGPLADFHMTSDEAWRQFNVAAWLHDCGKVTTPEFVVDKATKLETLYNRIHEVRMRFEVLLRDAEIDYYKERILGGESEHLRQRLHEKKEAIMADFAFVAQCNIGGEFMQDEDIERLHLIAERTWTRYLDDRLGISQHEAVLKKRDAQGAPPVEEHVLTDKVEHIISRPAHETLAENPHKFTMEIPENQYNLGELYNLSIRKGTLTPEDRFKINEHIIQTIVMLNRLPFPENMKDVPEIAGAHHETMIGTGYPRGLTRQDMSVSARIVAIADIFEALTAADRPYKEPKTLSASIRIMCVMRDEQHIDADLFDLFLESGVYRKYAEKFMEPSQVDCVDIGDAVSKKDQKIGME